jgi:hypothetical protein
MKTISALLLTMLCIACGGYGGSSKTAAPQPGVVPAITELVPDSAAAGGAGFTLTVNGSRFATNSVVKWNSAARTTTYVSGNQLTAAIPAADIATPGTVSVTVTNPGTSGGGQYGGGGTTSETSNTMTFTVN